MRKSVIKDIFYALQDNMQTMNIPKDIHENAEIIDDIYDRIKENLSPELLSLHQKLVDALEREWSEEVDFYFAEGFKMGLLVGIECTGE